jgi:hypothetical protein
MLGEADPAATMERLRKNDPQNAALKAVMMEWGQIWQDRPVTVHEMVDRAEKWDRSEGIGHYVFSEWRDAVMNVAAIGNNISRKKFGVWLGSVKDRIVAFEINQQRVLYKISEAGITGGRLKWVLVKIQVG